MAPCKATGPDGFSVGFYQQTWSTVGETVSKFALEFLDTGRLPAECNDTLITLIPKTVNPASVKQLRPIGLCNVSYKIITKTLATRLKKAA